MSTPKTETLQNAALMIWLPNCEHQKATNKLGDNSTVKRDMRRPIHYHCTIIAQLLSSIRVLITPAEVNNEEQKLRTKFVSWKKKAWERGPRLFIIFKLKSSQELLKLKSDKCSWALEFVGCSSVVELIVLSFCGFCTVVA